RISNLENCLSSTIDPSFHVDIHGFIRILHCVVDEILGDYLERNAIRVQSQIGIHIDSDHLEWHLVTDSHNFCAMLQKTPECDIFEIQPGAVVQDPACLQDIIDERGKAIDIVKHHSPEHFPLRIIDLLSPESLKTELQGREGTLQLMGDGVDEAVLPPHFL